MAKTKIDKIASIDEEMKQLAAQRTKLIQAHREQERKDRTKRLCARHGLLEKMLPEIITVTDEQFQAFLERAVTNSYGREILKKIIAQDSTATAPQGAGTAAQGKTAPAAKPPQTAQESGEGEDTDKGESARVSG